MNRWPNGSGAVLRKWRRWKERRSLNRGIRDEFTRDRGALRPNAGLAPAGQSFRREKDTGRAGPLIFMIVPPWSARLPCQRRAGFFHRLGGVHPYSPLGGSDHTGVRRPPAHPPSHKLRIRLGWNYPTLLKCGRNCFLYVRRTVWSLIESTTSSATRRSANSLRVQRWLLRRRTCRPRQLTEPRLCRPVSADARAGPASGVPRRRSSRSASSAAAHFPRCPHCRKTPRQSADPATPGHPHWPPVRCSRV